jgi:hypothetical protein
MTEKKYRFRAGARVKGVSAAVVADELVRIAERDHGISAEVVVDEARPEEAPLHPAFEWRDEVAADEWRLHQARNLIRHVVVQQEGQPEVPLVVHVQHGEVGYQLTEVVVEEPDLYAIALSNLEARVRAAEEAVVALERAARTKGAQGELLARIAVAVQAFAAARASLTALH